VGNVAPDSDDLLTQTTKNKETTRGQIIDFGLNNDNDIKRTQGTVQRLD